MSELLLELFSEEIPARMQVKAAADLMRLVCDGLKAEGLTLKAAASYVTPRRLVLHITGLPEKTEDVRSERRGPRVDAPEKAIEGFLRGAGITRDMCEESETPKGTFLLAVTEQKGRLVRDLLTDLIPSVVCSFPWPKSQRWGTGNLRWVRPLQSIVCLFGGQVVPFKIEELVSSNITYGHRFHAPAAIEVTDFEDYKRKLLAAYVQIDHTRRQTLIADTVETLAKASGLVWKGDKNLLAEVAGLVEWPVPMIAAFDPDFLQVPEEVLVLTMKQDQKYFTLHDPVTDKLASKFVFVANIDPADGGKTVVTGNERVVRARLSDARFFWEQDLKMPLSERLPALADIVFHKKLGTVADRVNRLVHLAGWVSDFIPGCDRARAEQAARLSKADLVSGMVYEFPEVQGVMGRYYALHAGLDAGVADALRDHYAPLGPSDVCPAAPISIAVALAEKIDTLTGFFAIGEPPTGSKDPYALRRAALGVIRLIEENSLRLNLLNFLDEALKAYGNKLPAPEESGFETIHLLDFIVDRLKVSFKEKGVRHDLVNASLCVAETAKDRGDLVLLLARVSALTDLLAGEDGANLLAGYRRAANILKAEEKKGSLPPELSVDPDLIVEESEKSLYHGLMEAKADASASLEAEDFGAGMKILARLRPPIDQFFEQVTVNADDPDLRHNRLALCQEIRSTVDHMADFSQIDG